MKANTDGLARERLVSGTYGRTSESLRLILREVRAATAQRSTMHLTARDVAVLRAIDQYRYLDTRHLRWLFFTSDRKARVPKPSVKGWADRVIRWPERRPRRPRHS